MDERQLKTNFLIELNELLSKYDACICLTGEPANDIITIWIDKNPETQRDTRSTLEIHLNQMLEPMFDINEILDR